MITKITLENFKCFSKVEIEPKLLTVLIGPNGTGKSSILQALLLLKQSVGRDRIRYQNGYVNLSNPGELFPKFKDVKQLEEEKKALIKFDITGKSDGKSLRYADSFHWNLEPAPDKDSQVSLSDFAQILSPLRFVPAVRGLARVCYDLGDRYEDQIHQSDGLGAYEEQLATNLIYGRTREERLSGLLKQVTGTGLRAEIVPSKSVEINSLTPSGAVNMVAEGFGANALIQLFHQLITADKGATVLIEGPEIHLHPKAQAELAEVLADTAKAETKQIIMTTHSEHLVERLLLLVAEGTLNTDNLAIFSFSKDEKGECSASGVEVTDNGQVKGGLTDFYANNLETLDRRVKVLKQSK